jgi:hypothetical protein
LEPQRNIPNRKLRIPFWPGMAAKAIWRTACLVPVEKEFGGGVALDAAARTATWLGQTPGWRREWSVKIK